MIAEINAAITSTKQIFDATKRVVQLSNDVELNKVMIDLQHQILNLQSTILNAQEQFDEQAQVIRDLEAKIDSFETWEEVAKRYKLEALLTGGYLYISDGQGEPLHWICPNCFEMRRKSLLQPADAYGMNYICPSCKTAVFTKRRPDGSAGLPGHK